MIYDLFQTNITSPPESGKVAFTVNQVGFLGEYNEENGKYENFTDLNGKSIDVSDIKQESDKVNQDLQKAKKEVLENKLFDKVQKQLGFTDNVDGSDYELNIVSEVDGQLKITTEEKQSLRNSNDIGNYKRDPHGIVNLYHGQPVLRLEEGL